MSTFAESTFAESALHPDGIIVWLAVGLIAGWFVGLVMKDSGYRLRSIPEHLKRGVQP